MNDNPFQNLQKKSVISFLEGPHLARLATCNPSTLQPHIVPVWYEWDGRSVWISSFRSTRKIKEIQKNERVALVVDTSPDGDTNLGVMFEGPVELVSDPQIGIRQGTSVYARYLGQEGAQAPTPQSWLHDAEHVLIKLTPDWVHVWGFPEE
jgi:nitroimidazol reductase NimA-like FMN-containing flavoprotein (pyridoxamine 5'-phosphate oxidase superfamily)